MKRNRFNRPPRTPSTYRLKAGRPFIYSKAYQEWKRAVTRNHADLPAPQRRPA